MGAVDIIRINSYIVGCKYAMLVTYLNDEVELIVT